MAQSLETACRIVLPFAPEHFRVTSVMDCPEAEEWNWGALFDDVIGIAQEKGELVVVETGEDRQVEYQAVKHAILDAVLKQGGIQVKQSDKEIPQDFRGRQGVGHARVPRDLTLHFAEEARVRGLVVKEILTWPK